MAMRGKTAVVRVGLLALLTALACVLSATGQGEQRGSLQKFMKRKLDLSKAVLEGLTLEDYALIAENARALRELSEDAQWRVSPNVNYLRLSNEFQDQAGDLTEKAKARNLDGATLAYVQMTMTCVKCHRLVRDAHLVTLGDTRADQNQDRR
jgi:hypothetical protein